MRKINSVWMFVACLTTLVFSCSSSEPAPDPELVASTEQLALSKDGETKSFYVKANTAWQLSSS